MNSVRRWIVTHPKPAKVILVILITAFGFFALDPQVYSFGIRFLIMFSMLYSAVLLVNAMPMKLLRKPIEMLEQQCDPYPFLAEVEHLIAACPNNPQKHFYQIHHALALVFTGQMDQALEVMEHIPMDQAPPQIKLLYHCNFCDLLFHLGQFEASSLHHEKALEIYAQMPDSRAKKSWEHTMDLNAIEENYRDGDYALALRKLSRIPSPTKRYVIEGALLAARCNLAMEDYDKATEKLQYVIDNGNKLYFVAEAKRLMIQISAKSIHQEEQS